MRDREPGDLTPIAAPAPAEVRQLLGGLNRFMERLQATLRPDADLPCRRRAPDPHAARHPARPGRSRGRGGRSGRPAQLRPQDPPQRRAGEPGHQPAAEPHHGQPSRPGRGARAGRAGGPAAPGGAAGGGRRRQPADRARPARARRAGHGRRRSRSPCARRSPTCSTMPAIMPATSIRCRSGSPRRRQGSWSRSPTAAPASPTPRRSRVLERFTRGSAGQDVAGSGLGLAIVKAVADAHGRRLTLLDRPGGGLIVRLSVPAPALPRRLPAATALPGGGGSSLAACPRLGRHRHRSIPSPQPETARLLIHAATDRPLMEPLLRDFQAVHRERGDRLSSTCRPAKSTPAWSAPRRPPDLAISSAHRPAGEAGQ